MGFKISFACLLVSLITTGLVLGLVLVSKNQIAQGQLVTVVLIAAGVAIAVGIIVGLVISAAIARPVKDLMTDVNVVSSGRLEYQARVTSSDEIGSLAQTFNRMTKLLKMAHQNELGQIAMRHELEVASQIQDHLLPKERLNIPNYENCAFYRASKEVSGDYYDLIQIDDRLVGITVADVSGKGVPAAIVMAMTRAFLRMEATRNISPADTLIKVNRLLSRDMKRGMFVTACYMILDIKSHIITLASAGHNPVIIWRAATNTLELSNTSGMALGFNQGPLFERSLTEVKISLGRGDRLLAYTDGLTEQMDSSKQMFGLKKLCQTVQKLATRDSEGVIDGLITMLDDYKKPQLQSDDITIVTLRRLE